MESIDLNRLKTAITYAERIADGKNPVTNAPAREEDVINNPNVIRCMFFIRDVLRQVYDNGGRVGGKPPKAPKPERKPFPLEALAAFSYRQDLGISALVQQINELIDQAEYEPLQRTAVSNWLEAEGLLTRVPDADGRRVSRPTDRGRAAGLYLIDRNYDDRSYSVVMYGKEAQEMIVSRIPEMLSARRKAPGSGGERANNSGVERPEGFLSDPGIPSDPVDRAYQRLGSAIIGE